jgi:hypothetical protein
VISGSCILGFAFEGDSGTAQWSHGGRTIAVRGGDGLIRVLRMTGVEPDPPYVTVFRVDRTGWQAGLPRDEYRATCGWCGQRFYVPSTVVSAIGAIGRDCRLGPSDPPCLRLPDDAWNDPRLVDDCPLCNEPLKFNPFIVDNHSGQPTQKPGKRRRWWLFGR